MAVTYTPNINLAKPTENEVAQDWTSVQKWAEYNNSIISGKVSYPFVAYTSAITAATTNPNLGGGGVYAEYFEFQGWIIGGFSLYSIDPGITSGTGAGGYGIRLPTLVDGTFHPLAAAYNDGTAAASTIGEGYYYDYSNIALSGTVAYDVIRISGVDYLRPITEIYSGKTVRWLGPGIPSPLAHGDALSGTFIYKKG